MMRARGVLVLTCLLGACEAEPVPGTPAKPTPADAGPEDGAAGDGAAADAHADADASPPSACDLVQAPSIAGGLALAIGRYAPAAALLGDGRALVAGGFDFAAGIQRSAELFDPATDALAPTGKLVVGRNFATATLLGSGGVLVAGGFSPTMGSLRHAEIFDAATETFHKSAGLMAVGREAHTATRLPDGRVLLAGGLQAAGFHFHDSADIYDPAAGSFAKLPASLGSRRAFHAAAWIEARGSVLLVGGDSGKGELDTAERYDVAQAELVPTADGLDRPAKALAAAPLADGRVLVTGGANATDGTLADAYLYDPDADAFVPTAPMATRRMAHTLTVLRDGRVLAVGGWSDSSDPSASTAVLELFDPKSEAWETLPVELARARLDHVAVRLDDCRVLVAGGQEVTAGEGPVAPTEVEVITIPTAGAASR